MKCAKPNWNVSNFELRVVSVHLETLCFYTDFGFCFVIIHSAYDLATENDQRRGCARRHTIVGCHGKLAAAGIESQSTPTSRPESRQSEFSTTVTINPLNPMNASTYSHTTEIIDIDEPEEPDEICAKEVMDKQWQETVNVSDRLALTLEEIVHIRSVMTKAELEGLPVGVRIKEDVERRKVCFLCLRTRFTIFGQWGVQCKLCHRTVCTKCHSKVCPRLIIQFEMLLRAHVVWCHTY